LIKECENLWDFIPRLSRIEDEHYVFFIFLGNWIKLDEELCPLILRNYKEERFSGQRYLRGLFYGK
jgi:hypothetical protein